MVGEIGARRRRGSRSQITLPQVVYWKAIEKRRSGQRDRRSGGDGEKEWELLLAAAPESAAATAAAVVFWSFRDERLRLDNLVFDRV